MASSRVSLEQHTAADRFPEELHLDIVYNKSVGLKLKRTHYYRYIDDWSLAMATDKSQKCKLNYEETSMC